MSLRNKTIFSFLPKPGIVAAFCAATLSALCSSARNPENPEDSIDWNHLDDFVVVKKRAGNFKLSGSGKRFQNRQVGTFQGSMLQPWRKFHNKPFGRRELFRPGHGRQTNQAPRPFRKLCTRVRDKNFMFFNQAKDIEYWAAFQGRLIYLYSLVLIPEDKLPV